MKPNNSPTGGSNFNRQAGGGLNAMHVTLHEMIAFAYDIRDHQLIGAGGWMDNDRWDVIAKSHNGEAVDARIPFEEAFHEIRLKLRTLLADRFQLKVHTETREMPIYVLIVAKNGPHIEPSKSDGLTINNRNGLVICKKITMQQFAGRALTWRMGRSVVDKTGLAGEHDFEIKYVEDRGAAAAADISGPDFLTAMQQQIGLKLEQAKGPVEVLIVDRAERASAN